MGISPQIRIVAAASGSKRSSKTLHRCLLLRENLSGLLTSRLSSPAFSGRHYKSVTSKPTTAAPKIVASRDVYISRMPVATTTVWGIRDTASQIVVKSW
jgi:hypothetical protein